MKSRTRRAENAGSNVPEGDRRRHAPRSRCGNPASAGFTLVELLIVLSIISLLIALLIVATAYLPQRARIENTRLFILALQTACNDYREQYGAGSLFPPMDPVSTTTTDTASDRSSANLAKYLGTPLYKERAVARVGIVPLPPVKQKALMVFDGDRRDPNDTECLVDAFGRRILYYTGKASGGDPFKGYPQHDQQFSGDAVHCDIVSDGPYAGGKDTDGKDCRLATFKVQLRLE
jgi:prepilin-type N-terminal cleavage/methylation domain-containing protein